MNKIKNLFYNIDKEAKELERIDNNYKLRVWIVLFSSAISLWAVHYLKFTTTFYMVIKSLEDIFDIQNHSLFNYLTTHYYSELFTYIWWGFWHYLFFLIVPMLIIKYLFKQKLSYYGWQIGNLYSHKALYLSIMIFLIAIVYIVSLNGDFSNFYPFYNQAHRSIFDFIAWEIIYLAQFVAIEFFFRGFILNGLKVPFGSLSIVVMIVPYMMIHLPKLPLEAFGALFFGILLGLLSFASRSIFGGVLLHICIALTLDISAIIQKLN